LSSGTTYSIVAQFVATDTVNYTDSDISEAITVTTRSSSSSGGGGNPDTTTTTTTTTTDTTDTTDTDTDTTTTDDTFNTTPIEVAAEAVMTTEEAAAAVEAMTDVEADAYYADAIAWAFEYGVTTGTSDTTFSPDLGCTRAQIVTYLYRLAGSPDVEGGTHDFDDVDNEAYYHDAILWAVANGITNGTSSTTFDPELICTRAQIVTFLHRFAGQPEADDHGFVDVDSEDYYNSAVAWAYENGITTGTSEDVFSPSNDCNRAQVVTLLYRYIVG
ncbi:MAG: S-layer homology domain-containing protein, partial [Oscillospiraceae bacterium]|nr:S-layer homology domain-containing protein [Oscillospiraceae bacterium]